MSHSQMEEEAARSTDNPHSLPAAIGFSSLEMLRNLSGSFLLHLLDPFGLLIYSVNE